MKLFAIDIRLTFSLWRMDFIVVSLNYENYDAFYTVQSIKHTEKNYKNSL